MDRHLTDHPGLARVIEKQMRNWELSRSQRRSPSGAGGADVADFITIANIVGAGGNAVAHLLAEKLGWPVFDRQILTHMAGDNELRTKLYASMDERDLGWCEDAIRSLMQRDFHKNDYFHRLTETVLMLARQGPGIFVGRGADLILTRSKGLRVKVIASRDHCAASFAERMNIPLDKAYESVDRIEEERRTFVQNHFRGVQDDATRFDLMISVEHFSPDQAVDIVLTALKARGITW